MDEQRSRSEPPAEDVAEMMSTLGSPVRLAILRQLREPRILKEIEVTPAREDGGRESRPISRQAVKEHLEQLLSLGVVTARETERSFGTTMEYLVNHQRLYALLEDVRSLAGLRPSEDPLSQTLDDAPAGAPATLDTPCLVMVKGLEEGATFDLRPSDGRSEWRIGRHRALDVPLDYDAFVSTENAVVRYRDGGYVVEDLPGSRNGTRVNFQPIPSGEPVPLSNGDVIGVGRSLLLFRE